MELARFVDVGSDEHSKFLMHLSCGVNMVYTVGCTRMGIQGLTINMLKK